MRYRLTTCCLILVPVFVFAQTKVDTLRAFQPTSGESSTFVVDLGSSLYTTKDSRIDHFMSTYGYETPLAIPVAVSLEALAMPSNSKMAYGVISKIIVSDQDLLTADFSLAAYRRFFVSKRIMFLAGLALGDHIERIVLNNKLPPSFDSAAKQYGELSLRRSGLTAETTAKVFWRILKTKNWGFGPFFGVAYDADLNSHWKLGYYAPDSNRFRRLSKHTGINSGHEFGWVLSAGISIDF